MQTVCFRDDTYVLRIDDDRDFEHGGTFIRATEARLFVVDLTRVDVVDEAGITALARAAGHTAIELVTEDPRVERMAAASTLPVHARLADALG